MPKRGARNTTLPSLPRPLPSLSKPLLTLITLPIAAKIRLPIEGEVSLSVAVLRVTLPPSPVDPAASEAEVVAEALMTAVEASVILPLPSPAN